MKKLRNKNGFTLIECLASILILGIGLVGVIGCMTSALLTNKKASNIQLATAEAQTRIEQMRGRGFGDVTYENFPAETTVSSLPQGQANTEIIDNFNSDERLKKLVVDVSWKSGDSTAHARLETIMTNRTGHIGS
jgi:prepilin-type N-terminal cleavage/methylation domain-containing protein